MYIAIPSQQTNGQAWLAAVSAIQDADGEAYNVVIDIANPVSSSEEDEFILTEVDDFLRSHNANGLSGVANTIFPQGLLDRHGPEDFYDVYNKKVLPRMKQMTHDWGRYFERMTAWKKISGKEIKVINPLEDLIECMKSQINSERTFKNIYELTIYDPTRDAGKVSNRQCLSFISFKLSDDNKLMLTALYRNHAYIARALGNFIGLGRLQAFVADQSGAKLGSLTCISTHAWIDQSKNKNNPKGWVLSEANDLVQKLRS